MQAEAELAAHRPPRFRPTRADLRAFCRQAWHGIALAALLGAAPAGAAPGDEGQRAYDARRYTEAQAAWAGPAADGDAASLLGLAVLADNGRGTPADPEAAAVLLARAAVRGSPRAALLLARQYADGRGLPRNPDQAETWFAAAAEGGANPSVRELTALRRQTFEPGAAGPLASAAPTAPPPESRLVQSEDAPAAELVWTAPVQPAPVRYFVEVVAIEAGRLRDVFAGYSERSAVLAALDRSPGNYAWRVFTVALDTPDYAASAWTRFDVVPP